MIAYTSGTTGRPKGAVHVHGGFLVKMASEAFYQADLHPDETLYWVTDMGWIMGPWEMIGAGCAGATVVLYEGAPDWPEPDRVWASVARHRVNVLGVSPTLIRALKTQGDEHVRKHDTSSLRIFGSTGEPWNPEPYKWLSEVVGGGRLPIINISGGTEVGACFITPYPVEEIKVCSLGGASHGMDIDVFDPQGRSDPRRGRRARVQASVAGHDAWDLGRPRALHRDLLVHVRGSLAARRLGARRRGGRLVPAGPLRRHDQRGRQAAGTGRGRVGARVASGGERVGGGGRAARDQGRGDLVLLRARADRAPTVSPRSSASSSQRSSGARSSLPGSCSWMRCRRPARRRS